MLEDFQKYTKKFEGLVLKPYKCPAGKLTIGYGRNLEDVGITDKEAEYLFKADFNRALQDAIILCKENGVNYKDLSERRLFVLTDMCFNLGINRTRGFKKALYALKKGLYDDVAKEMLDSKWARDVGNRAKTLAKMMREG